MAASSKILITGPESSGKTTLCRDIAWALDGLVRPEYARSYLSIHGPDYLADDLYKIWTRQCKEEQALEKQDHLVICDTAHLVMSVWNEVAFQDERLTLANLQHRIPLDYHHVFLCSPDLPWMPDPLRERPDKHDRTLLFERYREIIAAHGLAYTVIEGQNRLAQCLRTLIQVGLLA